MSALAPPGSVLWLLSHELRIGLRGFLSPKNGKKNRRIGLVILAVVLVLAGGMGGLALGKKLAGHTITPSPLLYLGVDVALAWLFTLMLAQTLTLATQMFYERSDLDLLLSSPIPPQRVLTVRALGIALFAAATYVALASLVVVPLAAAGRPQFLAVYGVVAALALLATAAGLGLALALFATIGPRRTRLVSQILAAVIGMSLFLLGQARNLLPEGMMARIAARIAHTDVSGFDPNAAYAWPARAFLGDGVALAGVLAIAVAVFLAAAAMAGRRFGGDAAAGAGVGSAGDARAAQRRAARGDKAAFGDGVMRTLVRKDVRLLIRDPWLLSQVGLQLVYFVFLTVVAVRAAGRNGPIALASGAAALVFICGQLAGNLTWVVISAEDAPELIACAPVAPRQVASAKLIAGLAPTAALAIGPVLAFAAIWPWAAVAAALGMGGAAGSSGLMNLWYAKPANRREFRRRRTTGGWAGIVELLVTLLWAVAAAMAVYGAHAPPVGLAALLPAAVAVGVLALMRKPLRYGVAMPD